MNNDLIEELNKNQNVMTILGNLMVYKYGHGYSFAGEPCERWTSLDGKTYTYSGWYGPGFEQIKEETSIFKLIYGLVEDLEHIRDDNPDLNNLTKVIDKLKDLDFKYLLIAECRRQFYTFVKNEHRYRRRDGYGYTYPPNSKKWPSKKDFKPKSI